MGGWSVRSVKPARFEPCRQIGTNRTKDEFR